MSERPKERDWKSRKCRKVLRGFKSRPLRFRRGPPGPLRATCCCGPPASISGSCARALQCHRVAAWFRIGRSSVSPRPCEPGRPTRHVSERRRLRCGGGSSRGATEHPCRVARRSAEEPVVRLRVGEPPRQGSRVHTAGSRGEARPGRRSRTQGARMRLRAVGRNAARGRPTPDRGPSAGGAGRQSARPFCGLRRAPATEGRRTIAAGARSACSRRNPAGRRHPDGRRGEDRRRRRRRRGLWLVAVG